MKHERDCFVGQGGSMSGSIEGRYGPEVLSPGREHQPSLERAAPQGIPGKGEPMVRICLLGKVCIFVVT